MAAVSKDRSVTGVENENLEIRFFFSSRRRHTRSLRDWSSDVCSSDLPTMPASPRRWWSSAISKARASSARRSEERRVGKECRSRWSPYEQKKEIGNTSRLLRLWVHADTSTMVSRLTGHQAARGDPQDE